MVVFFIAFRWIHLSTPLIRLFLLVLILLLMPTLHFLPVWLALSLLRFRRPSRRPRMGSRGVAAGPGALIPSLPRGARPPCPVRRASRGVEASRAGPTPQRLHA